MSEAGSIPVIQEPTDFGPHEYPGALVIVTNACNLRCTHCFVFREDTPNNPRDKMSDETMLHQLRVLRDRHNIRSMLFMGGEPMIKSNLVFDAMSLFERSSIVTNGTYGIPSIPGHLVTVSLDGPREVNDEIRGDGVFDKVRAAIHDRDIGDGTDVMLQMTLTKQNAPYLEEYVETVKDWPVSGLAFTFYVPDRNEVSTLAWDNLADRDRVIERLIRLKEQYPIIKTNVGALEMMMSDRCLEATGINGENCAMKRMLPLYVGDGGCFERTFCCYGNNVDCTRCGAYAVFNAAWHRHLASTEILAPSID